jgi:hypothetical protein
MATAATILSAVGYRTNLTISTTSDPTTATCLQWLNETLQWLTGVCAEERSELGRVLGSITTASGTASYSTLATLYAPYDFGWVVKTNSRDRVDLTTEESVLDHDPAVTNTNQPTHFYIDGSNNVVFLPTPDAVYTIKIPYWPVPTTISSTGTTVPFMGLFDNLIIESLVLKIQNRDEYDLSFELKWFQFLKEQARRVIVMRKGRTSSVGL